MSTEVKPIVSVVIPTRNRLPLLREAVHSVISQSALPCEAVVVDDASSDGTQPWLIEQAGSRLINVRLDRHVERAIARNQGLKMARGGFVLFLDDDDRLRPTALRTLFGALRQHPGAVGAVGARMLFNDEGQRRKLPHPRHRITRVVWPDLLAGWMSPPGTALWRRDILKEIGGWNEEITLSGDRELFLRAATKGPVVLIPDVVLDKRAHDDQWRADDIRERKEQWMRGFIATLRPDERARAARLLAACHLWNDGRIAYGNVRSGDALALYLKAVRTAPLLMTSPLLRPKISAGIAKSLAGVVGGRHAILKARAAKRRLLLALRKDVYEAKRELVGGDRGKR